LKTTLLYQGRVFGVRQDVVVEPGGIRATRDVVRHTGSVVLLPLFPDGTILLVRQYRHAVGQFLWELVAGRIEPGEPPLTAARRELLEETGYTARRLRKLLDVFPTPGFVNERMLVYLATGLRAGPAQPESDERITARRFSLAALDSMMRRGALRDAKSIAGILYYARFVHALRRRAASRS
jgi:ADP-ribose pyrophosphatase